ncbi:MAG: cyclic nucleotide-binding domain-containing protein [Pseudomonadota bacterium]
MELLKEAELLRKVPMFSKLDASKLKLLAFTSQLLTFDAEENLFEFDDPADCAYVIMDGEASVIADTDQGEVVASTLTRNQLCGEMGVLMKGKRTATVRASGHLKALRITDDAFLRLLSENPDVALDVMRQLSAKIELSHRMFEEAKNEAARASGG